MKIGFLGCGAMGSIYAGNLTKAHEVYIFDAMPAVCEAVNTTGITIDEPDGSTRVYHPVIATTDPSTIGENLGDLVVVADAVLQRQDDRLRPDAHAAEQDPASHL